MAEEWRSRRWRRLLNVIDGLRRTSHFVQAISDDDEYADMLATQPPERSRGPQLLDYSPEREALDMVVDRLGEVLQTLVAVNGGKPPKIRPVRRPDTAADRAGRKRAFLKHQSIVARMLPNG